MVKTYKIRRKTAGFCDILDLTDEIQRNIQDSKVVSGIVTIFVPGSTAGLTTIEYEPGLIQDLKDFHEQLIPSGKEYCHNQTWHDGNGFSHVRAALLKPSLTVPIVQGRMTLGTWQQIILIDFDNRPRTRELVEQIQGE